MEVKIEAEGVKRGESQRAEPGDVPSAHRWRNRCAQRFLTVKGVVAGRGRSQ